MTKNFLNKCNTISRNCISKAFNFVAEGSLLLDDNINPIKNEK